MKTKLFLIFSAFIVFLFSCKKDTQQEAFSASNQSNTASDQLLSVQVSIAPPATPSKFIANSSEDFPDAIVAYDLYAKVKDVYDDYYNFYVSSPLIYRINNTPASYFQAVGYHGKVYAHQYENSQFQLYFHPVDSSTSPTTVYCRLQSILYRTEDYLDYTINIDSASGTSVPFCLVNNIAHITFQNPLKYHVLPSGYTEIADVKLSGDTGWTLKSLPINYYFPDFSYGTYPTNLVVKYQGVKVPVKVEVDTLQHHAKITFKTPFQHSPGTKEILKIYAYNLHIYKPGYFFSEIGDLNGLVWTDGTGGLITGKLNSQFYSEPTGSAYITNF